MTPTQRETAERLAAYLERMPYDDMDLEAATLLRELLAEPQGAPVAWIVEGSEVDERGNKLNQREIDYQQDVVDTLPVGTKLYTHPPQQRKPLTDEQIHDIAKRVYGMTDWTHIDEMFARAIERAHDITEAP